MIKNILIIGASSDMGCSLIKTLDNPDVVFWAHYNSSAEKLEKLDLTGKINLVKANLLEEQEVEMLIATVAEGCGSPDQIVHFAAPRPNTVRYKDLIWKDFQKNIDIELRSIMMILNCFIPMMAKQKRGKVVFCLTSYVFNVPPRGLSNYVTVKYALLGLMKALASEYADKKLNINAVSPSMIETAFLSNLPGLVIESTAQSSPLKRNATTDDIIPAIEFLLSEKSDFINGVNIPVAGGTVF